MNTESGAPPAASPATQTAPTVPARPAPLTAVAGGATGLFVIASLVIIVAGIKAAEAIMVPFLLAAFVAVIAGTPVAWLESKGVGIVPSVFIVLLAMIVAFIAIGVIVGQTVNQFLQQLPFYEERVASIANDSAELLHRLNIAVDVSAIQDYADPGAVLGLVGTTLTRFGAVLSDSFLILFAAIFMLLEASTFPHKLRATLSDPDSTLTHVSRFTATLNRYMAIKTSMSIATGLTVWLFLALIGVDFALLWGLLAFLLNYIPNIGAILAGVPPVLLALVQLGPGSALLCVGVFTAIHLVFGNILETRLMGKGLGLSTLIVFFSLVFWGWALGPVGMLLSVPLTITVKIALEINPSTHWLAILLGPEDDLPPLPVARQDAAETQAKDLPQDDAKP